MIRSASRRSGNSRKSSRVSSQRSASLALPRQPVGVVRHDELLRRLGTVRSALVEPALLVRVVEGLPKSLAFGHVVQLGIDPGMAEADPGVPARALGEAGDGPGLRVEAPHVVAVVEEEGAVVLGPAGGAVGGRQVRVVVPLVPDRVGDFRACRHCFARAGDSGDGASVEAGHHPLAPGAVPPRRVLPCGRDGAAAEALHLLGEEPPLPGGRVEGVEVVVAPVPREELAVGRVGDAQGVSRVALRRVANRGHVRRAELDDPSAVHGKRRRVGALALFLCADQLHGLQVGVAPVPHVEDDLVLFQGVVVRLLRGRPGRDAEEDAAPALREDDLAVPADPPPLRDARALRIGHRRAHPVGGGPLVESELELGGLDGLGGLVGLGRFLRLPGHLALVGLVGFVGFVGLAALRPALPV